MKPESRANLKVILLVIACAVARSIADGGLSSLIDTVATWFPAVERAQVAKAIGKCFIGLFAVAFGYFFKSGMNNILKQLHKSFKITESQDEKELTWPEYFTGLAIIGAAAYPLVRAYEMLASYLNVQDEIWRQGIFVFVFFPFFCFFFIVLLKIRHGKNFEIKKLREYYKKRTYLK